MNVISIADRARIDCEEMREIADWLVQFGKNRNAQFLLDAASRYEVMAGAYTTAAIRLTEAEQASIGGAE